MEPCFPRLPVAMRFHDHSFTIGAIGINMGCLVLPHSFCAFSRSRMRLTAPMTNLHRPRQY